MNLVDRATVDGAFLDRVNKLLPYDELSSWAVVAGFCGLVAAIPVLPSALKAILLLTFVFLGPGSVGMHWFPGQPTIAVRVLVPVLGIAILILVISALLFMDIYHPLPTLLALALATVGSGLWLRRDADRLAAVSS